MPKASTDDPRWHTTASRDAAARRSELREAARRPVGVNLEEGARLCRQVGEIAGSVSSDPPDVRTT